jgi:GDPmannose 4,6-dehydratase
MRDPSPIRAHSHIDETLLRPTEIMSGRGNASKAGQKLGWKAKYQMEDVVRMIAEAHAGAREESGVRS